MALPPISPTQMIQLGIAAHAVGSAAISTFADLLHEAAELLGRPSPESPPNGGTSSASVGAAGRRSDLSVLQEQIQNLLAALHAGVQQLFQSNGLSIPAQGLIVGPGEDGRLHVADSSPQSQQIEQLLQNDESLLPLFQAVRARQELAQQAGGLPAEPSATIQLLPQSARFVGRSN